MFKFFVPKSPGRGTAPISKYNTNEGPVDWIAVFGNEDNDIDFENSTLLGEGMYGIARLVPNPKNLVVKYMDMRTDYRVVKDPEESYVEAFVRDIGREFEMQRLASTIIGIDSTPICPRVHAAGVFSKGGDKVSAVIVMDYLEGYKKMRSFYDIINKFDMDFTPIKDMYPMSNLKKVVHSI